MEAILDIKAVNVLVYSKVGALYQFIRLKTQERLPAPTQDGSRWESIRV